MKLHVLSLAVVAALVFSGFSLAESPHQLGGGVHYWKSLDDVDVDNVDEDGFAWVASYQYKPQLMGLGVDVEWKESGFGGSSEDVYEPQGYLIFGQSLYGAAGVGAYYSDGDFAEEPFYLFRAGLDLELIPAIHFDLHAIYRFESLDSLEDDDADIDTDTVTLGAALRFEL